MSYDPTQQVPPPQGYPPNYTVAQQPTVQQQPGAANYQQPVPATPPPYAPPVAPPTYTQYSNAPAPSTLTPGASSGFNLFWRNLGLVGQAAGAGGVLGFLFFLFPWVNDTTRVSYNGFGTASGFNSAVNVFPYVWLIFLGFLGLIGMVWPLSQRRWFTRQTAAAVIIAISGVMLALEICFIVEIGSLLNGSTSGGSGAGFWLDLLTTLAVVGVAGYGLVQERKAAQLLAANPYQAAQYPGSQPMAYTSTPQYPGSQPYGQPPQYPGSQPPQYPQQ